MHTVVLRPDVYTQRRWLAQSLYKAFEEARAATAERLAETAASLAMLPWLYDEVERTRQLMGRTSGPTAWRPTPRSCARSCATPRAGTD